MVPLTAFRHQETVAQTLHYLSLAGGVGEQTAGLEEPIGGPREALLAEMIARWAEATA